MKGRDRADASISQAMPKIAIKPPEAGRQAWTPLTLTALRRRQPCQHPDFRFPGSRTVRQ